MLTAKTVEALIGKRRREAPKSLPASMSGPDLLGSHASDGAEQEHTEPVAKRTRRSSLVSNQPTEIAKPAVGSISDRLKRAERRASQVVSGRR
jgi:hypothetical protein